MKEYIFENAMNSNISVTIKADTFSEAMNLLKTTIKYVEDYIYVDDKWKVLS